MIKNFSYIGNNDKVTMNYIKLKILVGFLLVYLIDQFCCETNTLEDKYKTGKDILLSITINHDNVKNFFTKFHKEYNHSSNIFKDENDKSIIDFIDLSKKRIFMEVNNLAQKLNKLSLDEQLKYEKFIRANIEIYKINVRFFNNCFKNNNLLNEILDCIDISQNTKTTKKADNEDYNNMKNLLDTYNSLLIQRIKLAEKNFITTTNEIIFLAKNNNDFLIKKKTSTSIPSTSSTNKMNQNLMYSGPHVNDSLKSIYIKQKNILNTANLEDLIVIQSIIVNTTLDHILKKNNIINNDRKNVQCCFDYSKVQLDKVKFIAVNDSDKCVEVELLNLKNLSSSNKNKEAEKYFSTCFHDNSELEDVFGCIGWLQSSKYALKALKLSYNEAVNKFYKNQELLTTRIFDCSYKSRDYFNQRLKHLNNQFDNCIQHQKSSDKCIEPTSDNFIPITLPPNTQIIKLDIVTVKP